MYISRREYQISWYQVAALIHAGPVTSPGTAATVTVTVRGVMGNAPLAPGPGIANHVREQGSVDRC